MGDMVYVHVSLLVSVYMQEKCIQYYARNSCTLKSIPPFDQCSGGTKTWHCQNKCFPLLRMCYESFVLTEFIIASQYIVLSSLSFLIPTLVENYSLNPSDVDYWSKNTFSETLQHIPPQRIWKSSAFILYTPNVYA